MYQRVLDFRQALRNFRATVPTLNKHFDGVENCPLPSLVPTIDAWKADCDAIVAGQADNAKLELMNKFIADRIQELAVDECTTFLDVQVGSIIDAVFANADKFVENVADGKKASFETTRKVMEGLRLSRDASDGPRLITTMKNLAESMEGTEFDVPASERAGRISSDACIFQDAVEVLKASSPFDEMTPLQEKNMALYVEMESLTQQIAVKEKKIEDMLADTTALKSESFKLTTESKQLQRQEDETSKQLRVATARARDVVTMKDTLEMCAAFLSAPKREKP